jgi:hypothetical protein
MFTISEESKVRLELQLLGRAACTNLPAGAHRPHHRCLPCCHSLWLPPIDSVSWILQQRAEAYPHSVSLPAMRGAARIESPLDYTLWPRLRDVRARSRHTYNMQTYEKYGESVFLDRGWSLGFEHD